MSRRQRSTQSGQAIVLIAIMLTVLIGMTAIAIDGSRAYALRRALQDAVDAGALAAADNLQQTGSFVTAEQAATTLFGRNMELYTAPSCSPGYGTPGAASWTVTCTYSDGTVLTDVARALGPQGSRFQLSATRNLGLQFGRVLTNGTSPTLGASSQGTVNNLLYTPAIAALDTAGCGTGGSAITVNGTGTLNVVGDVVANGAVSIVAGAVRDGGDIYSRCQSSIAGATNVCYPSGAGTPCTFPDVAGATRSGSRLADPGYPAPSVLGGAQGLPTSNVIVPAGIYSAQPSLSGDHCWFLSGGVYTFQLGAVNSGDFVSNELKPPDEPTSSSNTTRAANQFWDTGGADCSGAFQVQKLTGGTRDIPDGPWGFILTSTRSDSYNGVTYTRESAPSMCHAVTLNNHFDNVDIDISNVPGATAYNVYASPPPNGCSGPFGFATSVAVSTPVSNTNTNPCPAFVGNGCSLGHESATLSDQLAPPFAPNAAAAADTIGAYPPAGERAPLASGLPNQNPARATGATGDRANENTCKSTANAWVTCPAAVTPGAVMLNFPAGGCLSTGNGGDTYLFSGYQYNWVSVYEPAANACANSIGAASNSAFVGLIYCPSASLAITSSLTFESSGTGGVIADTLSFTGTLPSITFSSSYAPTPPASRLAA